MQNCIKFTVLLTFTEFHVNSIHTHGFSPYDIKYPFEHLNSNQSSETQSAQLDESKFKEDVESVENRTISDLVDAGCNCGVPHNAVYKLHNETGEDVLEADSVIDGLQSGVLGGEVTSRELFPWTVRIVFVCLTKERRKFSKQTLCSGSVISPRLVASSAHCFSKQMNTDRSHRNCLKRKDGRPVGKIMVDIGINSSELKRKSDIRDIEKVLTPDESEMFNSVNDLNSHDFALALLKEPLDLSGNIRSICLPKMDEEFDEKTATSVGWGLYEVYGKEFSKSPRKLDFTISKKKYRHRKLLGTKTNIDVNSEMFQDMCDGDSGSPLMYFDGQQYILIGTLVGMGYDCGQDRTINFQGSDDGIWNKVSFHMEFIQNMLSEYDEKLCLKHE